MWSFVICDSNSGRPIKRVQPSAGNARRIMNGVGSGTHTFQLRDERFKMPRATWRNLAIKWARTLVICWDDVPVYAGLLTKHRYRPRTGAMVFEHAELRTILARRHPYGVDGFETGDLEILNKAIQGHARAVIEAGLLLGAPRWNFPIVLPPDQSGGESELYPYWDLVLIEEMLHNIQARGLEIDFLPRWKANGYLEYEVRLGAPLLAGNTFSYAVSAERSGIMDLEIVEDGTDQLTGVIAAGNGAEALMRYAKAGEMPGSEVPYLDTSRPFKDEADQGKLTQIAETHLREHREATKQYDLKVLASGRRNPARFIPGSTVELAFQDDPFELDETVTNRVLGLSMNMTHGVTLELQKAGV